MSEYRTGDHKVLVQRARYHLRDAKVRRIRTHSGEVATYELLPDGDVSPRGSIFMVHGWTSEASFMMALAEPLRRSGFRVVLADSPAHGRSGGVRTNLVACSRALAEVANATGPFIGTVAHSMGALAALLAGRRQPALPHPVVFGKYCLIAAPNQFCEVTRRFAMQLGISGTACRQFERQLERISQLPMEEFSVARLLRDVDRPALVLHSRDNFEVPFHNALELAHGSDAIDLVTFDGLGHRRILYAPPVVRAVVRYFRPGPD